MKARDRSALDASAAEKMRGVKKVVRADDFVAVVADSWWRAKQALKQVNQRYKNEDCKAYGQYEELRRTYGQLAGLGSEDRLSSLEASADTKNKLDRWADSSASSSPFS